MGSIDSDSEFGQNPVPKRTRPASDRTGDKQEAWRPLHDLIRAELERAYAKHGREAWGRHEFYGIIKEEFDELWEDIKKDAPQEQLLKELVQVAAMCFRYFETGDKYRGPHPVI